MTQTISKRFVILGFLAGFLVGVLPATPDARADESAFERMYNVQQKGYTDYYRSIMNMGGKATTADMQRFDKMYIDPVREEKKKAQQEGFRKITQDSWKSLQGTIDVVRRAGEAEKTGKKPEKPAKQTQTAASGSKDADAKGGARKPAQTPRPSEPVKALDGKDLEDVIDF